MDLVGAPNDITESEPPDSLIVLTNAINNDNSTTAIIASTVFVIAATTATLCSFKNPSSFPCFRTLNESKDKNIQA